MKTSAESLSTLVSYLLTLSIVLAQLDFLKAKGLCLVASESDILCWETFKTIMKLFIWNYLLSIYSGPKIVLNALRPSFYLTFTIIPLGYIRTVMMFVL